MIVKGLNPIFIYLFQNLNCLNFLSPFAVSIANSKTKSCSNSNSIINHSDQLCNMAYFVSSAKLQCIIKKKFLQNLQLQVFGNTLKLIVVSCNFSLHNLQLQVFGTTLKLTVVSCNFSLFYVKRESMICNSPSSPFPTIYVFSARKKN